MGPVFAMFTHCELIDQIKFAPERAHKEKLEDK